MLTPTALRAKHCADARFTVVEATVKQGQFNRFLYTFVGSAWQWRDKLAWTDEQWSAYAESDSLRTFVAYYAGSPAGYFELSRSEDNEVELAYFGLAPRFIGKGLGGAFLSSAIEAAWEMNPKRVWVHTCNHDHPSALANYEARGFSVYRVEGCATSTDSTSKPENSGSEKTSVVDRPQEKAQATTPK